MSDERLLELIEKQDKYYILGFIKGIKANNEILQQDNQELKKMVELYSKSLYNAELIKLKQENQKYKETIYKLNESIIKLLDNTDDTTCYDIDRDCKNDLLDILKEVE